MDGFDPAVLDAICDTQETGLVLIDRDDRLLYASPLMAESFGISPFYLKPGTRLRDFLGAIHDQFVRPNQPAGSISREDWLTERVSAYWRERFETIDRSLKKRLVRLAMRRLPSGLGLGILTDVTEAKKREDQWRADLERVQLTEEILDSLPLPIVVLDLRFGLVGVNRAFAAAADQKAESLLERAASDIFDPHFLAELADAADQLRATPGTIQLESGPDRQSLALVHRVGRNEQAMTVLTFVSSERLRTCLAPVNSRIGERSAPGGPAAPSSAPPVTMRLLTVSRDPDFGPAAMARYGQGSIDHCQVRDLAELQSFLDLAEAATVEIALVVIDRSMPDSCATLVGRRGYRVILADPLAHPLAHPLAAQRSWPDAALQASADTRPGGGDTGEAAGRAADPAQAIAASAGPDDRANPFADPLDHPLGHPLDHAAPEAGDILVVEDNEVNQIVFAQILEGLGRPYRLAATAAEALDLWTAQRPAVVMIDISLPDMNGMDLCRLLRQRESTTGAHGLIIGVLVPAFDHDRPCCIDAGMDDVLVKPLSPDMIETLLDRHLRVDERHRKS